MYFIHVYLSLHTSKNSLFKSNFIHLHKSDIQWIIMCLWSLYPDNTGQRSQYQPLVCLANSRNNSSLNIKQTILWYQDFPQVQFRHLWRKKCKVIFFICIPISYKFQKKKWKYLEMRSCTHTPDSNQACSTPWSRLWASFHLKSLPTKASALQYHQTLNPHVAACQGEELGDKMWQDLH